MARGGGDRGDRGNVREKELEDVSEAENTPPSSSSLSL